MTLVRLFNGVSLNDIPGQLRQLADDIEKGEYGRARTALMMLDTDEEMISFAWGEYDSLRALGMVTLFQARMAEAY